MWKVYSKLSLVDRLSNDMICGHSDQFEQLHVQPNCLFTLVTAQRQCLIV